MGRLRLDALQAQLRQRSERRRNVFTVQIGVRRRRKSYKPSRIEHSVQMGFHPCKSLLLGASRMATGSPILVRFGAERRAARRGRLDGVLSSGKMFLFYHYGRGDVSLGIS